MMPRRATPAKSRAALLSQRQLGHIDRSLLPDPAEFYARELGALKGSGTWRDAVCPFHKDTKPSLRVKLATGAWHCFVCGEGGGDVLAFHRRKTGQGFIEACRALGCWVEG
ncbi:MAG: CHC2 zinc finger domain-containing protein [Betaproteobacteria bacterium]|nr:CHC2 zinc finger domain-containing protein [Betaproteobacteria bacterium]